MSTVKVNDIFDTSGVLPPDNLKPITAAAWVQFNGSGTVAIRDQFNVTSITDNSTGNYNVNFTTALADLNYCSAGSAGDGNAVTSIVSTETVESTSTLLMTVTNSSAGVVDRAVVNLMVFGGNT